MFATAYFKLLEPMSYFLTNLSMARRHLLRLHGV